MLIDEDGEVASQAQQSAVIRKIAEVAVVGDSIDILLEKLLQPASARPALVEGTANLFGVLTQLTDSFGLAEAAYIVHANVATLESMLGLDFTVRETADATH